MNEEYHYIDSPQALAEACQHWQGADFLALDTEFIRRDTFYPIAGLIQVGAFGECWLIDPLVIEDWTDFKALLCNAAIIKVLHSCSEDLEVFDRLCGALPAPLLDTQVGAGLAGIGEGLSYQKLVAECLQLHVEKGETRSDWLRRPLTASQCHYAALDVAYLQRVYPMIRQRLEEQGRLSWWQEDCQQITDQAEQPAAADQYYLRNKSLWKLNGPQRLVLQQLCSWREQQARQRDMPRGRILKDPVCFDIARRLPRTHAELASVKDLAPGALRRYGEQIIAIVEEARCADASRHPEPGVRPLSGEQSKRLSRLRQCAERCAEKLNIPAGLLCRKRDLEVLIRQRSLPDSFGQWRSQLLGEALLSALEEQV
ncbi:ribonuclease D [Spongiibacter sp.]|uniref:ribonuclease D n=1 Tax=Spongiibacter sp. TaxID=2024860 RepID=UPI003563BCA4